MSKQQNIDTGKVIEEISLQILQELSGDKLSLDSKFLNLSDPRFQLRTLNGLKDQKLLAMDKLEEINVNNNKLKNIDILTYFRRLIKINAMHNEIIDVNLKLDNLVELNLAYNRLTKIPNLNYLPRLEKFFIQNNEITTVGTEILALKQVLDNLDISYNQIVFHSGNELAMNGLRVLNFQKNPFDEQFPRCKDFFIRELCPQVENINGEVIPKERIKNLKNEIGFPKLSDYTNIQEKLKYQQQQQIQTIVSLSSMNNLIEQAFKSQALEKVSQLNTEVELLLKNPSQWDLIFVNQDPNQQAQLNDQMDQFLNESIKLIENNVHVSRTMLNIIASLSIIPQAAFGTKCLNTLNEVMNSGKEMQDIIQEVLINTIIPILQKQNCHEVPISVIQGLIIIAQNESFIDGSFKIFDKETINFFGFWIKQILQFHKQHLLGHEYQSDKNDLYDNALELISVVSKIPENAQQMRANKMTDDVSDLFKNILNTGFHSQYISLLQIIENIAQFDAIAGKEFLATKNAVDGLLKEIGEEIKSFFNEFKKNKQTLRNIIAKDTDQIVKIKYQKFASLIQAYGAVIKYFDFTLNDVQNDKILIEILQTALIGNINPILLTAICNFIYSLLQNDKIKVSPEMIRHLAFVQLNKLIPLLNQLNDNSYNNLCQMGELYYQGTYFGNAAIARNQLTNKVLQHLFISIVKILTFFSLMATKDTPVKNVCKEISLTLNQNHREQFYFNLMQIPSDELKINVIKGLLVVTTQEWGTEELGTLINMLSGYKNLGSGKTEKILSSIFMILSKICKDQSTKTGKDFTTMFAETAIGECLDILQRNISRNYSQEESNKNDEKISLALSCINFLQTVSHISALRPFLSGKMAQNAIKISLLNEEKTLKESYVPIEIEQTWAGRNLEYLLFCTIDKDSIDAYHIISYRIISRVADVLQGIAKEYFLDQTDESELFNSNENKLKVELQFKKRIQREQGVWQQIETDMSKVSEYETDHFIKQHNLFSNSKSIDKILMFLLGKNNSLKAVDLEKKIHDEFLQIPQYTRNVLREMLLKKVIQFENDEKQRVKAQNEAKLQSSSEQQKPVQKIGGKDALEIAFQQFDFLQTFSQSSIDKAIIKPPVTAIKSRFTNLTKQKQKFLQVYQTQQQYDLSDIQNVQQQLKIINFDDVIQKDQFEQHGSANSEIQLQKRSLVIAAMLRCIEASISSAPERELKKAAIESIKHKSTIKMLTQLCATTGWTRANVGSKYLKIIQYGLKMSNRIHQEDKENLEFYELISKAVQDILHIVRRRLLNEEKIPLTYEDRILIFELSSVVSIICQQISSFQWSQVPLIVRDHKDAAVLKSPQQKSVEFMLNNLIPKNEILIFVDIILSQIKFNSTLDKQPINDLKDLNIREQTSTLIQNIFGAYMSKCRDNKYSLLEYFMRQNVFDKKLIRNSYLFQALKELQRSNYMTALELYLLKKKLLLSEHQERILYLTHGQIIEEFSSTWNYRIIVFSNRGIYFLLPPKVQCTLCQPDIFCPDGPLLDFKLQYEYLKEVQELEGEQRLAFQFYRPESKPVSFLPWNKQNEKFLHIVMFSPFITSKKNILQIVSSFNHIKQTQDKYITIRGLEATVNNVCQTTTKENLLVCWAILNPNKTLIQEVKENQLFDYEQYFNKKILVVLRKEKLIILQEQFSKWFYFFLEKSNLKQLLQGGEDIYQLKNLQTKQTGESFAELESDYELSGNEEELEGEMGEKIKEAQKKTQQTNDQKQAQAKEKSEEIFKIYQHFEMYLVNNIDFSTDNVPIVGLNFGNIKVELMFYCDQAREKFRMSLLKSINPESWHKKEQNIAINNNNNIK